MWRGHDEIEPTNPIQGKCDLFIDAMKSIADVSRDQAEIVKTAPHTTRVPPSRRSWRRGANQFFWGFFALEACCSTQRAAD